MNDVSTALEPNNIYKRMTIMRVGREPFLEIRKQ